MNPDRRSVMKAGTMVLIGDVMAQMGCVSAAAGSDDVTPSGHTPGAPSPSTSGGGRGAAGDFDFLSGSWKVSHRRLKERWVATKDWDVFDGEATCWSVLGGIGSIEELRVPSRGFAGVGIRLLDVSEQRWADYWVSSKSGVLTPPPMWGGFAGGVGTFESDELDGDIPVRARGVWDRITPTSCRWYQTASRDGGKTWEENWAMEWTRTAL